MSASNRLRAFSTRMEFDAHRQAFFLNRLALMNDAGISLRAIFDNFRKFPGNNSESAIASHSLANISKGRPFADGYTERGWFNARATALLVAAEEHHCLRQTIGHLLRERETEASFWRAAVLANARWFLAVAVALIICMVLDSQEALFVKVLGAPSAWGQHLVFALGGALNAYGWAVASAAAGLAAGLAWHFYYYCGAWRARLDQRGAHALFRRYFLLALLPEMAQLIDAGSSPNSALDCCLRFYPRGYRQARLHALRAALAGGADLTDSIAEQLLDRRNKALLSSLAVTYPGQIAKVLRHLHESMHADAKVAYQALAGRVRFVAALSLMLLLYAVLDVIYATPSQLN